MLQYEGGTTQNLRKSNHGLRIINIGMRSQDLQEKYINDPKQRFRDELLFSK